MDAQHSRIAQKDVAWVLGSLCAFYRIPLDEALLLQQFPPPHTLLSLQRALQALGFHLSERTPGRNDFAKLALPALALLKPGSKDEDAPSIDAGAHACAGAVDPNSIDPAQVLDSEPASSGETDGSTPTLTPALLIKTDGERLLYFRAGSEIAQTLMVKDFAERFEPTLICVGRDLTSEAPKSEYADGLAEPPAKFGFRWFLPQLLKHKRIWRDVLFASLAIQLIGLATPLFTQVVIDKVVVHRTLSTLSVVGIGLAIFTVFGSVMGWLRQYLVIHTGNRIDAVLGSQVFRHLLRLPMPYLQHRPTGTLVARLHGVETIREFVTGAAVTLVLDLPFMLVFLAVMFFYSWQLTLIALGLLALITALSLIVTPQFRQRLNQQFLLGHATSPSSQSMFPVSRP